MCPCVLKFSCLCFVSQYLVVSLFFVSHSPPSHPDPPGPPFFEGYSQGETLRRGQQLQIACRSRGGNPPAQLVWYRNGEIVNSPQRTSGRLSENVYRFTANASDNGANLVCEAKNLLSNTPLRAELNLTVLCKCLISSPLASQL